MRTFHKTLPAQLMILLGLVLMLAPSAGAAALKVETVGSFGGFASPQGVAVDQSTGDVYVVDVATNTVDRFDAAGNAAPFAGVASYIAGNELTGSPAHAFSFTGPAAVQVAVDASAGPAHGEIYVTDNLNEVVDVFAQDGTFLGEVNPAVETPTNGAVNGGNPCGVAVDPSGDVYVAHVTGQVDEYAPATGDPAGDVFTRQLSVEPSTCVIAVDSTGLLSGLDAEALLVIRYPEFAILGSASSVAVDPANDSLLLDEKTKIAQLTSSLAPLGSFGELGESVGVAIDGETGLVYASDALAGSVTIYQTPIPAAPLLEAEQAANVASTSAELKALVNPHLANTRYYFQYGTSTAYTSGSAPNTAGIPVGESGEQQPAHVAIGGLQPNTLYHYRIVAFNQVKGKTETSIGPDHTFTTPETPPAQTPATIVNQPVEAASQGATPPPPATYPNLTALKPIPGPNETAGKPKTKTKPKRCKKGFARKHRRCVKRARTKRASSKAGRR